MTKEKLFKIADHMVDAILLEVTTNKVGYNKYPTKIQTMITNLESIVKLIQDEKV